MLTGKNYIGNTLKAGGSKKFRTFNPERNAFNECEHTQASHDEITEATRLAQKAFKSYRKTSSAERSRFLNTIADEIELLGDNLISIFCVESGLPENRARAERQRTTNQLRLFAELIKTDNWKRLSVDHGMPERLPTPKPDLLKTVLPLGPIVVFGASNFPLAYSTAGGDTASALAAGCPVIVKSHPMHAGTGELVASVIVKAAKETGMPNGVFSNLNSQGIEVGKELVLSPLVKGIGFTGSLNGGRAIFDLANSRSEPIPVFAEMGSINPVVISENSLLREADKWAETYADSITQGTGQFCTNPGLLLAVDCPELDIFSKLLAEKVVERVSTCMLHPNIKESFGILKHEITQFPGVQTLTASIEVKENYGEPTIAMVEGATFLENKKIHHEVFGPFSIIVKCSDRQQLLDIIENLEGQLTGTVIVQPDEFSSFQEVIDELKQRVGRIIFNGVPTGVEVCESMQHGGPYPASTDSRFTAVGPRSIDRWVRPVTFQNFPEELLPLELRD